MERHASDNYRSVSDVYAGKSIFVTGATGFVGKVFIEKILYSCPKISKVYILMRGYQNMGIDDRLKKILKIPLFDRLRNERPQDFDKIVPINGDICLPKLGMKEEDENFLLNTISMVFHIAANVKFNEPLGIAMSINVGGTKAVLEFCQRIKNLKAFVYVSTAFTNANVEFVEERVYPPPVPLDEAEKLAHRSFSKEETAKLLNGRINTYTFSKEVAENLVAKYQEVIPSAIVRPSIVLSSKSEPVAGWLDNWYGATGIVLPLAQGINWVLLTDPHNTIDLIPVDYVANIIILAATRCEGYGKYQQKSMKSQVASHSFTERTWKICAERTCALFASLSETERERFCCDPRSIVWDEFLVTYVEGIKKYLWDSSAQKKRN